MNYYVDLVAEYRYMDSDFKHTSNLIIKCDSMKKAVDIIDCLKSGCEILPGIENRPCGWSASLRIEKGDETDGE